ncbi:MFS family permease OS=Castellaniella defragrans OX=75697 GN=HNR28_000263 PE=4 SV=1 [Castellaniella defragrans]
MAFAGIACMGMALVGTPSPRAWLWLGLAALLGLAGASSLWRTPEGPIVMTSVDSRPPGPPGPRAPDEVATSPLHWGLIWCYGVYGFGYILPATFLPAQARLLVPDPLLFSLAWPVFGITGALATLIASRLARRYSRPQLWAGSQVIMAVGVFLPAVWHSLAAILIAACCVGSTFMVITMVGLQEAQHRAGTSGAKRQIAAMTASFALGQLIGPLFFSLTHTWFGAPLEFALVMGALGLLAGALPILRLR